MVQPPHPWTVADYLASNGETPIVTFLTGLDGRNKQQAAALLALLRDRGNALRPPQSKMVETGLFELRGHQVRIFYVFRPGRRIVLLDGLVKKQDEIPKEVLKRIRLMRQAVEAADRHAAGGP
jgi:hypothetical protein